MNLTKESPIWIYGIGKIGKRVYGILDVLGYPVKGIIVTRPETNPAYYERTPVFGIDRAEIEPDDVVLVAAYDIMQREIVRELKGRGYNNYLLWDRKLMQSLWRKASYVFQDQRKNSGKVCFVLSGYKEFLWDVVFARLERFLPNDVEVCICSSGIYVERLATIAKEHEWSYLSTSKNSVSLVQNIAFSLFEDYPWIYKMDEDIFLTQGIFERLFETYQRSSKETEYKIGFVAPVIPLNGYAYRRVLLNYDCLEEYERTFGRAYCGGNIAGEIETEEDAAIFIWGNERIPQIDQIEKDFRRNQNYSICNVRFSIGFILFHRSLWETMEGFSLQGNVDLGVDEEELCCWCMNYSRAIVVANNAVAGHFSFGKQTETMKKFFQKHPERFCLEE